MEMREEGDYICIYLSLRLYMYIPTATIIYVYTYRYTVTTRMTPALRRATMRAILMFHEL